MRAYPENVRTYTYKGKLLVSDGHIMCEWPKAIEGKEEPKMGELWERGLSTPVSAAPVGDLLKASGMVYRCIGATAINEAFFRCFNRAGITWTTTTPDSPVIARWSEVLVGIVVPVRHWQDLPAIKRTATDEELFAAFATPQNGFYLKSHSSLRRDLHDARDELRRLEDERRDTDGLIEETQKEIDALEAALKARKVTA